MTAPRQVLPGRFHLLTRRTSDRQYFLRPDEKLNNAFLYCLALVARRHGIQVIGFTVLSDHYHAVVYDPYGTINEFNTDFHALVARCVNALRGRAGHFWDAKPPSVVDLLDASAVIEKAVYVMSNPVKHDLVAKVDDWPGLSSFASMNGGKALTATRPDHFFSARGNLPDTITLEIGVPAELGDENDVIAVITKAVRAVEVARNAQRHRAGRAVVGRKRILGASWTDRATSATTFRELRPRFASRDRLERVRAIENHRAFVRAYRHARELWLAGLDAVFPAGTYWLSRFMGVPTEA